MGVVLYNLISGVFTPLKYFYGLSINRGYASNPSKGVTRPR